MPPKTSKKIADIEEASRVMIADDSVEIRRYLSSQLEVMGFNVVASAATGEEAVPLYDEARFNEFKTLKTEVGNLKDAIETRKLVEKAKGILMKRLSISEDDAFKLLQTQSQKENKKLRDIAETVITASKLI